MVVPNKLFLTKGVGRDKEKLASFELALRNAGIEKYNLVHVSSILPPNCKMISKEEGLKYLNSGEIVYCVMARVENNERNRLAAASIGVAIPSDPNQYGYLSEHHAYGETDEIAGDYAEDLAAYMLGTTLGIEVPENLGYDEKAKVYKMSDKIIKTKNITQSAEGKNGLWTTVITAAVLITDGKQPAAEDKNNKLETLVAETKQLC
ncbi:arginine decarboxylase, pyruvoyl-dependent [Candidatus Pacearchaeota archaeon]|nr:arginine decarboxylase, pyruvoyl-dependent [Candidatus Pacearchaeota archaeon]